MKEKIKKKSTKCYEKDGKDHKRLKAKLLGKKKKKVKEERMEKE